MIYLKELRNVRCHSSQFHFSGRPPLGDNVNCIEQTLNAVECWVY
jgi:hypothetical protein